MYSFSFSLFLVGRKSERRNETSSVAFCFCTAFCEIEKARYQRQNSFGTLLVSISLFQKLKVIIKIIASKPLNFKVNSLTCDLVGFHKTSSTWKKLGMYVH